MGMRPVVDILDGGALDMHAAHENRIGPGEIRIVGRREVLVDEPKLPVLRQRGGDDEKPLRRHEGARVAPERKGMLEGPE